MLKRSKRETLSHLFVRKVSILLHCNVDETRSFTNYVTAMKIGKKTKAAKLKERPVAPSVIVVSFLAGFLVRLIVYPNFE